MNDTFRVRLRKLRLEAGKKQDEIAQQLGVNRSTYGEYERGKIMPPIDKLEQLARLFGVSPASLMGWDKVAEETMDKPVDLAAQIKQLRETKNITMEEISEELHIPLNLLEEYESGTRKIPYSVIKKMAKFFNVDLVHLYGMEFEAVGGESELEATAKRLAQAERWGSEFGKIVFTADELEELINYTKYILSKRVK